MSFIDWLSGRSEIHVPNSASKEFGPLQDELPSDLPETSLRPVDKDRDGIPDAIAGLCILIDYVDVSGAKSRRRVIVDKIYKQSGTQYLTGLCLLRQEQRTFRVDRILTLCLPPHWNEVDDPSEFLSRYEALEEVEPEHARWDDYAKKAERYARLYDTRKAANHGLRVLAFVARSDGTLADQERVVIQDYVKDVSELIGERLDNRDAHEIAIDIDKLFPTKRQVANSLNTIRLYQEQSQIFLESVTRLVRADGEVNEKEHTAFELLVEILRKPVTEGVRKRAGL